MTHPVASIVIPLKAQNDAWLSKCILSAVRQTIPCEVILVTHPATPTSNRRAIEDLRIDCPNLLVKLREGEPSFARAINQGFDMATTERVGLLLSDDWLELDTLEQCVACSADIVCTGMTYYDDEGEIFLVRIPTRREYEELPEVFSKASYLKHFFLFNKAKFEQVGGVDESIGDTGPDDYDLIWTLLEHEATVDFVEAPLYNYRDHCGERLTLRDRSDQILDLCKILDKHRITGPERERLIAESSRWYGQPQHVVLRAASRAVGCDRSPDLSEMRRND